MASILTAGALADALGARLLGDPEQPITGIASLEAAGPTDLTHLSSPRLRDRLADCAAGAVLVREADAPAVNGVALVVEDPYLAYARASRHFDDAPAVATGRHDSASVAADAQLAPSVALGAGCFIGAGARLEADVQVGPNAVVGEGVRIGAGTVVHAGVVVAHGVRIGERCVLHPGAVVGADGFGFAVGAGGRRERIAQLGGVRIGDDVEIGANSTVDRGALGDTVVERGVKIDNQVQIGHNVVIGEDTVICGCVGISGSARIGARCILAGGVGVGGDGPVTIADDCVVTGMSHVSRSLDTPGLYSAGTLIQPSTRWKRNALRMTSLDSLARRVAELEARIAASSLDAGEEDEEQP